MGRHTDTNQINQPVSAYSDKVHLLWQYTEWTAMVRVLKRELQFSVAVLRVLELWIQSILFIYQYI